MNFWLVMIWNLVFCLLVTLLSHRASESFLGSSASSQQKAIKRAWRIVWKLACLLSNHSLLARTQSHGHGYLQGRLGNVCAMAKSPPV